MVCLIMFAVIAPALRHRNKSDMQIILLEYLLNDW